MSQKQYVDLTKVICQGVIALQPSGVTYINKCGGQLARIHVEVEGIFIPFHQMIPARLMALVANHQPGDIDDEVADEIDKLLRPTLKMYRTRLSESMEAWLHIVMEGTNSHIWQGFQGLPAVLTWTL